MLSNASPIENRASLDSVFVEESASESDRLMSEQTVQIEEASICFRMTLFVLHLPTRRGDSIGEALQSKRGELDDYEFNQDAIACFRFKL